MPYCLGSELQRALIQLFSSLPADVQQVGTRKETVVGITPSLPDSPRSPKTRQERARQYTNRNPIDDVNKNVPRIARPWCWSASRFFWPPPAGSASPSTPPSSDSAFVRVLCVGGYSSTVAGPRPQTATEGEDRETGDVKQCKTI